MKIPKGLKKVAEAEKRAISDRTKAALATVKKPKQSPKQLYHLLLQSLDNAFKYAESLSNHPDTDGVFHPMIDPQQEIADRIKAIIETTDLTDYLN